MWAIENYAECCKIADQIAAKEVEEEEDEVVMDDGQKMDEIIRYIRSLTKPLDFELVTEDLRDLENQLNTKLTEKFNEISDGQRYKVCFYLV